MRYRKHGLGLGGLIAVAALGITVFASSAQAVDFPSPDFYVNGSPNNLAATLNGKQLGVGSLLIPGLASEINCNKFSVVAGNLNNNSDASGELLFKECVARELAAPLNALPGCTILNGNHITATGLVLPAELTDGSYAVLIEKIDALIPFQSGSGCVLPTDNLVKGELCGKLLNNHAAELEIEFSQEIQGLCRLRLVLETGVEGSTGVKDKLLYGAQEAFVDAKVDVFLEGPHLSKTLGVLLLP